MMAIKEIRPMDLTENVFKLISQDWMLVSAVHDGKVNGMTASWGGLGLSLARPVAYVSFVRRATRKSSSTHPTASPFDL